VKSFAPHRFFTLYLFLQFVIVTSCSGDTGKDIVALILFGPPVAIVVVLFVVVSYFASKGSKSPKDKDKKNRLL
jgi:hypothetical protein